MLFDMRTLACCVARVIGLDMRAKFLLDSGYPSPSLTGIHPHWSGTVLARRLAPGDGVPPVARHQPSGVRTVELKRREGDGPGRG